MRRGAVLSLVFTLSEAAVGAGLVLFKLAVTDPAFPRYPALPVVRCAGYRALPGAAPGR